MNELIDIHTHIIPGVDDGARTDEVSKSMINRYRETGFSSVIATPHTPIIAEPEYIEKISAGYEKVVDLGVNQGIEFRRGFEVRLSPELLVNDTLLSTFGLAGTKYILMDFPSGAWPYYAEDTLFRVQTLGLTPILAHPERYGWGPTYKSTATSLVKRGVLLQVTLGSLVGAFGGDAKAIARSLLKSELVHFTATDAHSAGSRMDAAISGLAWLRRVYGAPVVERTLIANPEAMLSDGTIEPFEPLRRRRLWNGLDFRRLLPGY